MLAGVVGAIHGNLPAFQAVLDALDAEGILTIFSTGNAVVGYTWPADVIDALRRRNVISVQGEWDRRVVRYARKMHATKSRLSDSAENAVAWTSAHVSSTRLEYLRELPRQRTLTFEGVAISVIHGTAGSQSDALHDDDNEMKFQRVRESLNVPLILCGKTHSPFYRWVDNALFVNPGSLGLPKAGDGIAQYAVINTDETPWRVRLEQARYDAEQIRTTMREAALDPPLNYLECA